MASAYAKFITANKIFTRLTNSDKSIFDKSNFDKSATRLMPNLFGYC